MNSENKDKDQIEDRTPKDFAVDNSTVEEMKKFREVRPKEDNNRYTGRRFHLTIHGQRDSDLQSLIKFFNLPEWTKKELIQSSYYSDSDCIVNSVTCAVIAQEFGKFKIHPHWQVYFEIATRIGMYFIIYTVLGHDNFHLEKAKSTTSASIAYVYAVDKPHEAGFVVYNKNAAVPERYNDRAVKFWRNFTPRPFQRDILKLTTEEPDRRKIYYFYESEGNTGKSVLIEYLHIFHGAVVTGGNSADMKYAIERWSQITGAYPVFICVDVARSEQLTKESYKAIEAIKNGLFFTGKYESTMTHSFVKPHVLIFSNSKPERKNFSHDRWKVFTIDKNFSLVEEKDDF